MIRLITLVLAVLSVAFVAGAQSGGKAPVVGFLGSSTPALQGLALDAFQGRLRELGYIEGRNVIVAYRWAEGANDRYPALIADLLRLEPMVVVSECGPALKAIRATSRTVPVVVSACADPAHFHGEIETFRRPGGQTTGFTFLAPEAAGKRLELLREVVPKLGRVAVLHNAIEPWSSYWGEITPAAQRLNVTLHRYTAESPRDFERLFAAMSRDRIDGVVTFPDALTLSQRGQITELALKHRLPTMFDIRGFVLVGGLMSYGAAPADLFRGAATYVDRILRGAKAGELPIQQPTRLEFVLNLKTAKAIGVVIPPSLRLRADHVVE